MFFLLQTRPRRLPRGAARGVCRSASLNAPEDLYDDEHLRARGFFVEVDHPGHRAGRPSPWRAVPVLGAGAGRAHRSRRRASASTRTAVADRRERRPATVTHLDAAGRR